MALTKADLIEAIQSNNGLTKKQSTTFVETTIVLIKNILASGEDGRSPFDASIDSVVG